MPTRLYNFSEGDRNRKLEVSWEGNGFVISNLSLRLDNVLIGTVATKDELRAGKEFKLPDNTRISIYYKGLFLRVFKNGTLLRSPSLTFNIALGIIYSWAILSIIWGLIYPTNLWAFGFAIVYFVLGIIARAKPTVIMYAMALIVGIQVPILIISEQGHWGYSALILMICSIGLVFERMHNGVKAFKVIRSWQEGTGS